MITPRSRTVQFAAATKRFFCVFHNQREPPATVMAAEMATMRMILEDDAKSRGGNWLHLPHILLLVCTYSVALVRLLLSPQYRVSKIIVNDQLPPLELYENHIGNYATLKRAPETWMLASHMVMALFWAVSCLAQKLLIRGMLTSKACRCAHAVLGTAMCAVGFFGCSVGGLMAYLNHHHGLMRCFLMVLPSTFLPPIAMTWWTARKRALVDHRFWATSAFVAPCLSNVWADYLIHWFGRSTLLGPHRGELLAVVIAGVLHFAVIILPAWIKRCRQQVTPNRRNFHFASTRTRPAPYSLVRCGAPTCHLRSKSRAWSCRSTMSLTYFK